MNVRNIAVVLLISGLLLTAACGDGGEKVSLDSVVEAKDRPSATEPETPQQDEAAPAGDQVQLGTVELLTGSSSYEAVGSFIAFETVTVSPKVGGTLASMRVDKGDRVGSKTLISTIDTEDYELTVEAAKAQLAVIEASLKNAVNEFERKKKLFEDGAISAGQFDGVSTQLELAQANKRAAEVQLRQAEKALRDTKTFAGANGLVSHRMMAAGEFVGAGDPLLEISVLDPIKLTFSVPERLAAEVMPGAEVTATLAAFPGRVFSGTVTLVGPTINPETRTIPLEAEFKNADMALKPGFFANATIQLGQQRRVFSIPTAALVEVDGSVQVCVVEGGNELWVPVIPVQRLGNSTRVLAELENGQRVKLQR